MDARVSDVREAAGLCGECAHALIRPTRKGTTYLRCGLARTDPRFPRYPRLPVIACEGFTPMAEDRPQKT